MLSAYCYYLSYKTVRKCKCRFFESIPWNDNSRKIFWVRKPYTNDFKRISSKYSLRNVAISNIIWNAQNGWSNETKDLFKSFDSPKNELLVYNSCLLWGSHIIIPFQLRDKVLDDLHSNHIGIVCMKEIARSCLVTWNGQFYWSCYSCQVHQNIPAAAPIHPWENTTSPLMHIDFADGAVQNYKTAMKKWWEWVSTLDQYTL